MEVSDEGKPPQLTAAMLENHMNEAHTLTNIQRLERHFDTLEANGAHRRRERQMVFKMLRDSGRHAVVGTRSILHDLGQEVGRLRRDFPDNPELVLGEAMAMLKKKMGGHLCYHCYCRRMRTCECDDDDHHFMPSDIFFYYYEKIQGQPHEREAMQEFELAALHTSKRVTYNNAVRKVGRKGGMWAKNGLLDLKAIHQLSNTIKKDS